MKLEVLSDNRNGTYIVRDVRDRVYIGPLTPPQGARGRAYYLNLASGAKVTADLAIELIFPDSIAKPAEPKPGAPPRKCKQCGGQMPEGSHARALYCSDRCKAVAKTERDGQKANESEGEQAAASA